MPSLDKTRAKNLARPLPSRHTHTPANSRHSIRTDHWTIQGLISFSSRQNPQLFALFLIINKSKARGRFIWAKIVIIFSLPQETTQQPAGPKYLEYPPCHPVRLPRLPHADDRPPAGRVLGPLFAYGLPWCYFIPVNNLLGAGVLGVVSAAFVFLWRYTTRYPPAPNHPLQSPV